MKDTRPPRPLGTVANFGEDRLSLRIERAVAGILQHGKVVAPVDVLVAMDLLAPEHLDDWRRGKVPYLERVIHCNLSSCRGSCASSGFMCTISISPRR